MKYLTLFIFLVPTLLFAQSKVHNNIFPGYDQIIKIKVLDPISVEPINTEILQFLKDKKILGFARLINTTTGCNSACLPVVYSSYYNHKGEFKKILSKDGLTKINHTSFTKEDYSNLEFIISMAPPIFNTIKHPKELTDAISGETVKKYRDIVVKGAAYSTLRIHLYNQLTISEIKKLGSQNPEPKRMKIP